MEIYRTTDEIKFDSFNGKRNFDLLCKPIFSVFYYDHTKFFVVWYSVNSTLKVSEGWRKNENSLQIFARLIIENDNNEGEYIYFEYKTLI